MNIRRFIRKSPHPLARAARSVVQYGRYASVPAPKFLFLPLVYGWTVAQLAYFFVKRKLLVEPFLKVRCASYGKRLQTGHFVHWIDGAGDIVLGDDVYLDGRVDVMFSSLASPRPQLSIGSRTYINHMTSFSIARCISIGEDVYVASGVKFLDSPGHPVDPARRRAKMPPDLEEVKPIRIGNNVWIGMDAIILPGVVVGDGSVVGTRSVVTADVPKYCVVGGAPARVIRHLEEP
jgi:hypothetical protein